jgi:hypothetical protein
MRSELCYLAFETFRIPAKTMYQIFTLALISLFHPSSKGMMFGTLLPFGLASVAVDISDVLYVNASKGKEVTCGIDDRRVLYV